MEREFAKLHGLGNDFVFFDGMEGDVELDAEEVRRICDRHFGIGADGVIVVRPPRTEDASGYMHYINSDGTLAQMCGNGVRCFAKYLVDGRAEALDLHRRYAGEDGFRDRRYGSTDRRSRPRSRQSSGERHVRRWGKVRKGSGFNVALGRLPFHLRFDGEPACRVLYRRLG